MVPFRLLPVVLLGLLAVAIPACGESPATPSDPVTDKVLPGARGPASQASAEDDWALLETMVSEDEIDLLAPLQTSEGAAGPVPDPDTHFPIEGPQGGALFPLGEGHGFYEFSHNEHWGISALYVYDARMRLRSFDVPPVLNVHVDGESFALAPGRERFEDEAQDGGWHFEDDALLGYPDSGRFRLVVDGRTYTPVFAHIHVGHGHTHEGEHATGPHLHGLGPHKGYIVTLGAHQAHLEIVHKPHWGILGIYLYDAALKPRELDAAPILNIVCEGVPYQLTAGTANWDGEEDGGWHFEDDALLGETGPARFRLLMDGKTYTPRFTYYEHGQEPGHAHAADGEHAEADLAAH